MYVNKLEKIAVLFLKNFVIFFYYVKALMSIIKLNRITINFCLILYYNMYTMN